MTTEEDPMSDNKGTHDVAKKNQNSEQLVVPENQYFYEDLVFKIKDKRVCFGMVVDNYEDNDSDSDPDDYDSPPLSKGNVRVSWYPHGWDQVVKERTVGLADRSLMPGDVVRRLIQTKPRDAQHGYCREIKVSTAVQLVGTRNVIPSVWNERLVPLDRYPLDLVACLGPWVGSVKEHQIILTLVMLMGGPGTDGGSVAARLELVHSNVCNLKPVEKRRWPASFGECEHYIGQMLAVKPCDLQGVRWLSGSKELQSSRRRHRFTVENLKTLAVGVHWQCQGMSDLGGDHPAPEQPVYLITGDLLKDLKILNVFETCTSQMGDRNYLTIVESDTFEPKSKWLRRQSRSFRGVQKSSDTSLDNAHTNENKTTVVSLDELVNDSICYDSDDEEWSTEESDDSSSVTNSCSSTASGSGGRGTATVLATKVLKRKLKKERKSRPAIKPIKLATPPPEAGQAALVETLCTSSIATVVWQDGTVEGGILSTQLFPIHHLDDQEFFPGDFVIRGGSSQDLRDYGVVQHVNHAARTALVRWFRTYAAVTTNATENEPLSPSTHGETEVSVYDLKDHPDFNFRPGTVVIRVAGGCSNTDGTTAGQVLDNFPEGRISVRWVSGHQSMCWPQDLYRVGEYDSDEGELWDDDGADSMAADDSWETQSEESLAGDALETGPALRPRLAANIERSCDAMARLEDMFAQNPALQSRDVMRKLLEVYKDCRYLDRLMGTVIFHEQHFTALLERVKARDTRSTVAQKIQRQVQRLFSAETDTTLDDSVLQTDTNITSAKEKYIETFSGQTNVDAEIARYNTEVNNCQNDNKLHNSDTIVETLLNAQKITDVAVNGTENFTNWAAVSDSHVTPITKTTEILTNIVNVVEDTIQVAINNKTNSISTVKSDDTKTVLMSKESQLNLNQSPSNRTLKTLFTSSPNTPEKNVNTSVLESCHHDSGISSVPQTSDSSSDSVEALNSSHVAQTPTNSTVISTTSFSKSTSLSGNTSTNACKELCSLIKSRLVIAHAEVLKRLGTSEIINTLRNEPEEDDAFEFVVEEITSQNSTSKVDNAPDLDQSMELQQEENSNSGEGFTVLEHASVSHKYYLSIVQPPESQNWIKAVRREFKLLGRALPPGVWVRAYEDRLDILSLMIRGPAGTPYEDGLFLFDIQLGPNYPLSPPHFHYISYCSDRLNPNLYEDGKVCVSLLGTWSGRGSEVWGPTSTLLQVIVSIQGLILNTEPYYNEAGYERQRGSTLGRENSRMYNEMVTLKLVQAMTKLLQSPHEVFKEEIYVHFGKCAKYLCDRLDILLTNTEEHNNLKTSASQVSIGTSTERVDNSFCNSNHMNLDNNTKNKLTEISNSHDDIMDNKNEPHGTNSNANQDSNSSVPGFPLLPASKGFTLSMRSALPIFKEVLKKYNLLEQKPL